ncbi:sensor histidine kinase [Bacillus sp. 1P06AnD]|uniref:sensor histidine kinase n=1 Tax=Bacillus sp. 1P06AnD TaxID=3132208 RepID=UPI0039A09E0C
MRNSKGYLKMVFGGATMVLFIAACFSAGYFIIYLLPIHPPPYIQYLATIFTSSTLIFLIGYLIHFFNHDKQQRIYQEIITALKKIAGGDFSVKLDLQVEQRWEMTEIIDHFNHMTKQLKQMEDLRQEFISNVSHEIQSPLTSIVGFTQALKTGHLTPEERNHYLSIIETESRRLSKLSDNLLKLTSLESEHHPFDQQDYRLDLQLKTIILACEPNWLKKNIEMNADLSRVDICADEDLMSQVWTNLIHNAIKFTPHNGCISVSLKQTGREAIISITDNGIGISKEDQFHIFERFYKADQARERTKSGSGLGLSIVKKIVDMHQGSISVSSEPQKGTVFTICLPMHKKESFQ